MLHTFDREVLELVVLLQGGGGLVGGGVVEGLVGGGGWGGGVFGGRGRSHVQSDVAVGGEWKGMGWDGVEWRKRLLGSIRCWLVELEIKWQAPSCAT